MIKCISRSIQKRQHTSVGQVGTPTRTKTFPPPLCAPVLHSFKSKTVFNHFLDAGPRVVL